MAFASIVTPPPSLLKMDTLIKWDPDLFFTPADSAPINISNGDEMAFSAIVSDGQWTSSVEAWMTALGYPSFKGYHR